MEAVLREYQQSVHGSAVVACGNGGGMSGAQIWRIDAPQPLCLRRWPVEHPSPEHLAWIHRHLLHAARQGCTFVPAPLRTASGATFVRHQGALWELTPWLPGAADFHDNPSSVRLTAILQAVARLHAAFAETEPPRPGFSLGLQHRLQQLRTINARQFILWRDAVEALPKGEVRAACGEILAQIPARYEAAERAVAQAALITVPLQPCVRDIWHDHLLLSGNSVTGIVDYGAMRVESRAGDLARLLGSLVRDDRDRWQLALQAYATLNPLRDPELQQLEAFDRANVVLSGVNWITWLAVERRDFPSMDPVLRRLAEICTRLKTR